MAADPDVVVEGRVGQLVGGLPQPLHQVSEAPTLGPVALQHILQRGLDLRLKIRRKGLVNIHHSPRVVVQKEQPLEEDTRRVGVGVVAGHELRHLVCQQGAVVQAVVEAEVVVNLGGHRVGPLDDPIGARIDQPLALGHVLGLDAQEIDQGRRLRERDPRLASQHGQEGAEA